MGELSLRVKDLDPSLRPREKAFSFGISSLSDRELLCLILSSGGKGKGVVELSSCLLTDFGGLASLSGTPFLMLEREKGIGRAKSTLLGACFEWGRRMGRKESGSPFQDAIRRDFSELGQEALYAYFLGERGEVKGKRLLLRGGGKSLMGEKKALFSSLLYAPDGDVVLVHCHPSGLPLPSKEDLSFTAAVKEFLRNFSSGLKDHLILTQSGVYSFKGNGLL
ncbi:MAG TPA: hypothetical protein DEA63_00065 [Firmicutes bacterium]|nr:hypothetical protein [Bacillota bacterium]